MCSKYDGLYEEIQTSMSSSWCVDRFSGKAISSTVTMVAGVLPLCPSRNLFFFSWLFFVNFLAWLYFNVPLVLIHFHSFIHSLIYSFLYSWHLILSYLSIYSLIHLFIYLQYFYLAFIIVYYFVSHFLCISVYHSTLAISNSLLRATQLIDKKLNSHISAKSQYFYLVFKSI